MAKNSVDDKPPRVMIVNGREYFPLADFRKLTARYRQAERASIQLRFQKHVQDLMRKRPDRIVELAPFLKRKPTKKTRDELAALWATPPDELAALLATPPDELVALLATPFDTMRPLKRKNVKQG